MRLDKWLWAARFFKTRTLAADAVEGGKVNWQGQRTKPARELKPGDDFPRHFHHGVETGYVLQGSMIQVPGQAPMMLATGSPVFNLRDAPHAGYKVVGPGNLIIFTTHIVDKGKPLYEWVK